jgi:hypothetical protein
MFEVLTSMLLSGSSISALTLLRAPGSPYAGIAGEHPVQDKQIKRLRHLNFFQHKCFLEVRVPRVRLPNSSYDWSNLIGSASSTASRCCSRRSY